MYQFDPTQYWLIAEILKSGLALVYLTGFLVAVNQFRALHGEDGILPAKTIVERTSFWQTPSLFHLDPADSSFRFAAWTGVAISLLTLAGIPGQYGTITAMAAWFLLWVLYQSFVTVGQTFYGFGWESLLLEAGFLAIFLGPATTAAPVIVVWLFRWLLFRVMFGAGLIKIRGDKCWRDLTCMQHHYETQPMPNPLSWFFDKLPLWMHKVSVFVNHVVELAIPFLYFAPQPLATYAGLTTIVFMGWLMLSGNFSWLNFLTMILAVSTLDGSWLAAVLGIQLPATAPIPLLHQYSVYALLVLVAVLSYWPVKNLFSSRQIMNTSFDPLNLVNTYGAFGSITKQRNEIEIQGTKADDPSEEDWEAYRFKGKPGEPDHMPRQFAPYHLRLDWQLWFAAMSSPYYHPWFRELLKKLLDGNNDVLGLLRHNPFPDEPPEKIRAILYRYEFTSWQEWWETGDWWRREKLREYYPAVTRSMLR